MLGTSVYDPEKYAVYPKHSDDGLLTDSILPPMDVKAIRMFTDAPEEHKRSKEALVDRITSAFAGETFVQELIRRIRENGDDRKRQI